MRKVFGDAGIDLVFYESGSKLKEIDGKRIFSGELLLKRSWEVVRMVVLMMVIIGGIGV